MNALVRAFLATVAITPPAIAQQNSDELERPSEFALELLEARQEKKGPLGATLTSDTSPPEISDYALNMIGHFEGWEPEKYDDPAGYCTIGYGRLFAKQTCESLTESQILEHVTLEEWENGLTEARGKELLSQDLLVARRFVADAVYDSVQLSNDQSSALVSFTFNVGGGNLLRSTLLTKVNESNFEAALREFPLWVRAGNQVLRGLQIRRDCEATLFSGVLENRTSEEFSRLDCQVFGATLSLGELIDIYEGE